MAAKRGKRAAPASEQHRPRVYIETSVVSYLTARPARDLVIAAKQEVTREWWAKRGEYELYVSRLVLDEAAGGDTTAAKQRLDAVVGVAVSRW